MKQVLIHGKASFGIERIVAEKELKNRLNWEFEISQYRQRAVYKNIYSPHAARKTVMNENDDSILVALSRNGDRSAFAALFNKYRPRLLKHIGRTLPNRADAEDVVQDAFLNALRAIPDFREDSCFFTWLYKIAINRAFSLVRNGRRRLPFSQSFVLCDADDGHDHMRAMFLESDNPAEVVHTNRMLIKIDHQLNNMPRIFSDAFLLREINGLSYEEISDQMHCSVGTVRSRLFRARQIINAGLQTM